MTNTLQDTDEFLVSRNSQSFTVETQNIMSTLQDTDLLLVNRNSNSFSVTFETLKDDIGGGGSPVVINSAQLSEDNPDDDPRFTSQKFDFAVSCAATSSVPLTYKLRAYVSGNILAPVETGEITGVDTATYSDGTITGQTSAGLGWPQAFEANPNTYCETSTGTSLTFANPISFTTLKLRATGNNTTGITLNGSLTFQPTYGSLASAVFEDVVGLTSPLTSIELPNGFYVLAGVEVDGVQLTDNQTILTLADDTGLSLLSAGDSIRQENSTGGTSLWNGPTSDTGQVSPDTANGPVIAYSAAPQVFTVTNDGGNSGIQIYTSNDGINWTYEDVTSGSNKSLNSSSARWVAAGGSSTNTRQISASNDFVWDKSLNTQDFDQKADCVIDVAPFSPTGTVGGIGGNTITLSESSGTWGPANNGHYVIGPEKVQPNTKLYLNIDANGGITHFPTDTDPGFTEMVSGSTISEAFQLTFPAVFSDGGAPDDDLPIDTSLSVDLQVINANSAVQRLAVDHLTDQVVTPIGPDGPQATMHGLRFNGDRGTELGRTYAGSNSFTFSFWVKRTFGDTRFAISSATGIQSDVFIRSDYLALASANLNFQGNTPVPQKVWTHCVISCDGTNVKLYQNNVEDTFSSVGDGDLTAFLNAFTSEKYRRVGNLNNTEQGYLSDLYYVDGQSRLPTTFAKDFDGKWGPLDSTKVIENVGDFGAAGFYLPFNPAATGLRYSSNCYSTDVNALPKAGNMFDGKMFDDANNTWFNSVTNGATVGATFDTPLNGSISVGTSPDGGRSVSVTHSGGVTTLTSTGYLLDFGNLTGVTKVESTSTSLGGYLSGVAVDGNALVDHNNIGVDASGKGNNFHDSNFAVGNAVSQQWSSKITMEGGPPNYGTPASMFDGRDTDEGRLISAPNGKIVWDASSFNLSGSLRVSSQSKRKVTVTSDAGSTTLQADSTSVLKWLDFGNLTNITSIEGFANSDGRTTGVIAAVELDGVILADANIQDTVLDTPMLDYSVLDRGENGNLVADSATSTLSYKGKAGTNYYFEKDGVGDVYVGNAANPPGGITTNATYNFGQQPFANQYNNSQVWSAGAQDFWWAPYAGGTVYPPTLLFDGNLSVGGFCGGNSDGYIDMNVTITNSLRLAGYGLNCWFVTIDGTEHTVPFQSGSAPITFVDVPYTGQLTKIRNTGNAGSVAAVEVDGKILLDAVNSSQTWSSGISGSIWTSQSPTRAFDGDLSTFVAPASQSTLTWTPPSTVSISSSLRVYAAREVSAADLTVAFSDSSTQNDFIPSNNTAGWYTVPSAAGKTLSTISWTATSAWVQLFAVEVDGKILVDPALGGIPGAVGNELKRTWKEWNNVAFLRMSNPMHVAAFNAVEASIQAYPARAEAHRDDLMTRLTTAGILTQEINATFGN